MVYGRRMTTNQTGELIAAAIRTAERSQTWVADSAGMTPATLRRKLRGGEFTIPEVARIARVLGVAPVTLLPAEFRVEGTAA